MSGVVERIIISRKPHKRLQAPQRQTRSTINLPQKEIHSYELKPRGSIEYAQHNHTDHFAASDATGISCLTLTGKFKTLIFFAFSFLDFKLSTKNSRASVWNFGSSSIGGFLHFV